MLKTLDCGSWAGSVAGSGCGSASGSGFPAGFGGGEAFTFGFAIVVAAFLTTAGLSGAGPVPGFVVCSLINRDYRHFRHLSGSP